MSKKRKNKNSVTVTKEVIENENIANDKQGGRIMAMLNGMLENANNDVDVKNGGNIMNNTQNNNNNQVAQAAQQVMQQATVAGQQGQVPVFVNPNTAAQAQYVMTQQGQAVPVQFVDPNQIQQLMQQQAVAQQLTNPNPATQAQQVIAVPAQGQVQSQPAQGQGQQQPKVVYVQVPVPAQAQTQEQPAPQVVEVESESSFTDDHPILTLGLMAAGAYVGYKFISNVFFDDNNSSSAAVSDNDTIDLVPADFSSFF